MDDITAMELAYKNGFEAGRQAAEKEVSSWQAEYRLAAAANKQLAAALDKKDVYLFAAVRNLAIMPLGKSLGKSETEITDKVFEVIEELKQAVNIDEMTAKMALRTEADNG